jgi:hypothetical protein
MAWTEITREKYRRDGLRYASGTTNREWAELEPLLPAARRLEGWAKDKVRFPTLRDASLTARLTRLTGRPSG